MRAPSRRQFSRYVVRGEDARKGSLVGFDHRYASDSVARTVAEVISSTGTSCFPLRQTLPHAGRLQLSRTQSWPGIGVVVTRQPQPLLLERHQVQSQLRQQRATRIVAQIGE